MAWLLTEILVFIAAAVVFGGLMGLALASYRTKGRVIAPEHEHKDVLDQLGTYQRAQRGIEMKAVARAAAEAAARGDLEARLVEMETAAAAYRARAEAAERRLHVLEPSAGAAPGGGVPEDAPDAAAVMVEAQAGEAEAAPPRAAAGNGEAASLRASLAAAEAERDQARASAAVAEREAAAARVSSAQELESLRAQLTLAERARARAEIDLAVAEARVAEAMRSGPPPGDGDALAGARPEGLPGPRNGKPDDLRRIRGVGPKNEGVLNALGLYHYEQIASLSPENVAWLDAYLKFHGRIARDDWVGQAKALLDSAKEPGDKVHPSAAGM